MAAQANSTDPPRIPISISARHVHLTQETVERLFGAGHRLQIKTPLVQPGQYAARDTVTLIGPRGRLEHVRVLGPPRNEDQIEISFSDERILGLDAPLRLSSDLRGTPGLTLEGPTGRVTVPRGAICALRHIHMSPADAARFGLRDRDRVQVAVDSIERALIFDDVVVRVSPAYRLELHLDTDEGNAAGLHGAATGRLIVPAPVSR